MAGNRRNKNYSTILNDLALEVSQIYDSHSEKHLKVYNTQIYICSIKCIIIRALAYRLFAVL